MNRPLAFICALLLASLSVSSACLAERSDWIHFILEPDGSNRAEIRASFRDQSRGDHERDWSTGFSPFDLVGLEVSPFHAPGSRPLHFALVREAGRLDCAGHGGEGYAAGTCSFSPDPTFNRILASRGIARPTREQAFALMAVNVRRDLLEAVAAARYPVPTIDNLLALSAIGVDRRYIREMAGAGYRPQSLQRLIEFKALGIDPNWIAGLARIGYANIPGDGLVQMRALGITPAYIEGFRRIGYGDLPVSTLVELKALDITPHFVTSVARSGAVTPVSEVIEMKMFGRRR